MRLERPVFLVVGLLLLAGLSLFTFELLRQSPSSAVSATESSRAAASTPGSIPPAPPLPPPGIKEKSGSPAPADHFDDTRLSYDEARSFADNLKRFRDFCRSHEGDPQLEPLTREFVEVLPQKSSNQFAAVTNLLGRTEGPAAYRNVLLACLVSSQGPARAKADIIWRTALDANEPVETRRTASFLTGKVNDGEKRSAELYTLLNDPDSQVVLFALENSAPHLDQRDYDLIRTGLVHSSDIHLQVAAVNAVGSAPFPDSQAALAGILDSIQTSKEDPLSEPSLLKRAAISHLDLSNPATLERVKGIALDANEDPGVRAKAIERLTPGQFPGAADFLTALLDKLGPNDGLPLRAAIDALLTVPTPAREQAIRRKLAELPDGQLRQLLLARVNAATQGVKP